MDTILIKCTVKDAVTKKLFTMSSVILIIPALLFWILNFYASIFFMIVYIVAIYLIVNLDTFCLTYDGVYVCKRTGRKIYGYKYDDIERVDIINSENTFGIKITNGKFKEPLMVLRDKTKIIVPDYVDNFSSFLRILDAKVSDKFSKELKDYLDVNIKSGD